MAEQIRAVLTHHGFTPDDADACLSILVGELTKRTDWNDNADARISLCHRVAHHLATMQTGKGSTREDFKKKFDHYYLLVSGVFSGVVSSLLASALIAGGVERIKASGNQSPAREGRDANNLSDQDWFLSIRWEDWFRLGGSALAQILDPLRPGYRHRVLLPKGLPVMFSKWADPNAITRSDTAYFPTFPRNPVAEIAYADIPKNRKITNEPLYPRTFLRIDGEQIRIAERLGTNPNDFSA
jgi:hypothetical protein